MFSVLCLYYNEEYTLFFVASISSIYRIRPWLGPKPGQANTLGLGLNFSRPKPGKARPKPWLSGQAKPANH
jgi:hypothetical protein